MSCSWSICQCDLIPTTDETPLTFSSTALSPTIATSLGSPNLYNCVPPKIEVLEQLVGPDHWARKTKSRKARILRCRTSQALAQDGTRGECFVIKVLGKQHSEDAKREANIMKQLGNHSHIVTYLSHFIEKSQHNIALLPAACCDLADFMMHISESTCKQSLCTESTEDESQTTENSPQRSRIYESPHEVPLHHQLRLILSSIPCLCSALLWVHQKGFCHRDIKPENILVGTNGNVTLADFGSARKTEELASWPPYSSTQCLIGFGKKYAAPEVWMLESAHTESCDLFSLGIVFTEILTLGSGRELKCYEEFRLQESISFPRWKQPGHTQTLNRSRLWLQSLEVLVLSVYGHHSPEKNEECVSHVVAVTAQMIDRVPKERPPLDIVFQASSLAFRSTSAKNK